MEVPWFGGIPVDYDLAAAPQTTGNSNWKSREKDSCRRPQFVWSGVGRFLLPSDSCVCVELQPLLKGYKVQSVHNGEATVQNLRQQGDENIDAGPGCRR